jgi:glycosyltransferase involved in cell wall biosynthesis
MTPVPVILVGQTPPPVHGQALAIQRLVRARFDRVVTHHVPMDFSSEMADVGRARFRKLWRLARLIWRVLRVRSRTGAKVLYYPPAGPFLVPVIRDIIFLTVVRPFFPVLVFDIHAGGLPDMESRLPAPLRPLFRRAYHDATLAIHKYPPEWNPRVLPARRDVVVPNGIEDEFPAFRDQPRRANGFTALYVGILTPSKGIWTLLDAIPELLERGVDVRAVFVGEFASGRTEAEWDARVARMGIGGQMRRTGRLDGEAKWREFRNADVFCFPSHYENEALPLVIMEAMQFALPVVASTWRGIPLLVEDGATGFLIPPRDPAALADRLEQLAADPAARSAMGERARRSYLERYTMDVHLRGMEDALLLAAGGVSAGPEA